MALSKIKTNSISDDAVTAAKIATGTIVAADLAADSVDSSELVAGSVDTAHIAADNIVASLIADDVINSEHYAAASIDNEHLADDAVDSDELAAGSVDLAHMSVNSIDSDQYVDGSIDTAHIANDQITAALIADNAIDSDMYVDGSIDNAHIADNALDSEHYAAGSIDLEHMSSESVDEDNLHISNAGSNGEFLSKQSGNAGGLTWASVTTDLVGDTTPQLGGFLDANGNYMQTEKGGDIASASPTVIDTDGDYFDVTGTTNFSAFTVAADRQFTLQFDGILTMTHHATNLDLPGEANITTAAGDVATFQSTGANTVQCINYTRASGEPIVGGATATLGFFEHTHTIAANLTITTDYNAISAGPITINSSISVTVPSGSTWVIA